MNFAEMDLKLDEFVPYLSVATSHTQTLLGHLVPCPYPKFSRQEHVLALDDGDELHLEYFDNHSSFTVSLYHGLAGDSQSDYIRRSAILAHRLGWNLIMVNHRGLRNTKAKHTYHSGRGEDAAAVIRWARARFPGSRHTALGFSMSGTILLNLLTERSGKDQPDFAVVVNAPLNLSRSAELLSLGFSRVYDIRFYLLLKKIIHEREKGAVKMPFLARTRDIDEWYSSKINGFRDAQDYYQSCSVVGYTDRIRTKTFVLTSYDDPFVEVGDYLNEKWSSNVNLVTQKFGGHMGYFARKNDPRYGHRWLDHYLESVFRKIEALSAS